MKHTYTRHQISELKKCMEDPAYFIENYVKIINHERGEVPFELTDFQKDALGVMQQNPRVLIDKPRQVGATTLVLAKMLHTIVFKQDQAVALLANKHASAIHHLSMLKRMYDHLPIWMQHEVLQWNRSYVELENGTRILAAPYGSNSTRGWAFTDIVMDEFAYASNVKEFMYHTFPMLTWERVRVICASTSRPGSEFNRMWNDMSHNFALMTWGVPIKRTTPEAQRSVDMNEMCYQRWYNRSTFFQRLDVSSKVDGPKICGSIEPRCRYMLTKNS